MTRKFITSFVASSLALTAATTAPVKADEEDVLKALLVGAVIAGIANAMDDDDEAEAAPEPVPAEEGVVGVPPIYIPPVDIATLVPVTPVTYSTGGIDIPQTWVADLDEGGLASDSRGDLWFQAETSTRKFMTPLNGASIAVGDRTNRGFLGCSNAAFSYDSVPVRAIPVGSYICVKTSEGRVSQFRMNDYAAGSPASLRIGYTTWK
ncbi:hypothetical protein [Halocynthiibacter styelae]|uniref:Uncharacterized protein n=1 Tax=Halocynthiibacter styelae TaxID=2761955 RepID=A0A8J7LKW5_9RHOB|nr:hypothetical protein [Paenihalocynthiibacter styelae]MBI1494780.1 hypothetical protein [Paenihalocynthiibacter styelae]